ncbi:hypothetical protein PMAYCL1PPCAC_24451 [Pristionchus mayeri]|uniref:Uncharacterized protein n=1 Tax=Pristionchus mayeri TaxID=1317129 RepID=A0AAN5I8K2_9BILA|nr:hypothetical protein PMAYCL1PPCAC_24451 [Pristionchus mayeri]
MSTITCSNFLPRVQLIPYEEGRHLLTAHGPFLELYDLDRFHSDDFDAREYEPIRTHVFEKHKVRSFVILESGHVLALSSNHEKNKLTVQGCIVHRDLILRGGYTDKSSIHSLIEEPSRSDAYCTAVIPGSNEVLLLTQSTLTHFQFLFEDDSNVVCDVIEKFELQTLLSPLYSRRPIDPLAIDSSSEYTIIISVGDSIVLLKYSSLERNKWACRAIHDPKGSLLGLSRVMVIPGMEVAVIAGKFFTKFISTSFRQSGVSKDQIRVLHEEIEMEKTKVMGCSSRDGIALVYLIRNWDFTLWKVHKQSVTRERTFMHSSDDRIQETAKKQQIQEKSVIRKDKKSVTYERVMVNNKKENIVCSEPISAIVMRRNFVNSTDLLIISYASGGVKVLRTEDIIKDPVCSFIHLGRKNLPVENLYPCWEFPLDPVTPLTRLIGISNGIPFLFKLKKGLWTSTDLLPSRKKKYSHVSSSAAKFGYTIAVFYNQHDICFCFFNEKFEKKEYELNCEIKCCYINSTTIVITTLEKILLLDLRGSLTTDENEGYYRASLDFAKIGVSAKEISQGVESAFCRKRDHQWADCYIQFKCGQMRTVPMELSDNSREYTIQEMYDSSFEGSVMGMEEESSTASGKYTIGLASDERGNNFSLKKCGTLCRASEIPGSNRIWTTNLSKSLPEGTHLLGFIPIQATNADDHDTYVLAKEKGGEFLYLQDAAEKEDIVDEPVPSKFWNSHIFGHFVGPKENGRCALYSTSTRKYGEPELMRVEVRVSHARKRENLVMDGSLSQPNRILRLVHRMGKNSIVVSACANRIEMHELSSKGRLNLKKAIELTNEKEEAIVITYFDTYFPQSSNTLYIGTASLSGEFTLITWDSLTNEHNCNSTSTDNAIHRLFFICDESSSLPPTHILSLNESFLMVHEVSSNTTKQPKRYPLHSLFRSQDSANALDHKVLIACHGEGIDMHDMWVVSKEEVALFAGKTNHTFTKNIDNFSLSSWEGELESIFFLSTRNPATSDIYANFVFVAKGRGQIGVFASIQTIEQPPTTILFEELRKGTKSKSTAIHGELLNCTVQGEDKIEVKIRLFIASYRAISIEEINASITTSRLELVKHSKQGKIRMTTTDPTQIVVSRMEERTNRPTPKYAIVSGSEGTETVRICENKLRR